jgi:hypothetical protein
MISDFEQKTNKVTIKSNISITLAILQERIGLTALTIFSVNIYHNNALQNRK